MVKNSLKIWPKSLYFDTSYTTFFLYFAGKAAIEIDDERTTTLIEKVNELLEAFIGIDDLELGKIISNVDF